MNILSKRLYYSPDSTNPSPYLCEEVSHQRLPTSTLNEIIEEFLRSQSLENTLDILAFEAKYIGNAFAWLRFQLVFHSALQSHLEVPFEQNPCFRTQCRFEEYLLQNVVLPYCQYLRRISCCFEVYSALTGDTPTPSSLFIVPGANIMRSALQITDFIERMEDAAKEICPVLLDIEEALSKDIVRIYQAINNTTPNCETMRRAMVEMDGQITSRIFSNSILGEHLETTVILRRSPKWKDEETRSN